MATNFDNVIVVDLDENGKYKQASEARCTVDMSRQGDSVVLCVYNGNMIIRTVCI